MLGFVLGTVLLDGAEVVGTDEDPLDGVPDGVDCVPESLPPQPDTRPAVIATVTAAVRYLAIVTPRPAWFARTLSVRGGLRCQRPIRVVVEVPKRSATRFLSPAGKG